MAKRVSKNKKMIIEAYVDYVLRNSKEPDSVYAFMSDMGLKEAEFYKHFGSFESVNQSIFNSFFENVIDLLDKDENYAEYDSKDKLLSFYFTYFEVLTANRSYVKMILGSEFPNMKALNTLKEVRHDFLDYIGKLKLPEIDLQMENIQDVAKKSRNEIFWQQFLVTLKFWLDDSSQNFEKTDIFIEKSINTGFSIANVEPFRNVIDLGKFILKERLGVKVER